MLFCCPSQAVELQGREAELRRQEAFYKEQLARIEKKVRLSFLSLFLAPAGVGHRSVWIQRIENQEVLCCNLERSAPSILSAPHPLCK